MGERLDKTLIDDRIDDRKPPTQHYLANALTRYLAGEVPEGDLLIWHYEGMNVMRLKKD